MNIFLTITLYTVVLACDYVPIIKEYPTKEIWVYGGILFFGFMILILYSFEINVPSLTIMITHLGEQTLMRLGLWDLIKS